MPTPDVFEVPDIASAIALASQLKSEGRYDYFRGQTDATWRLRSSISRLPESDHPIAIEKFGRFHHWVRSSEDVLPYVRTEDQILAIAQHYGLPTPLLDLTTDPTVAGFFAVHNRGATSHGAIYMIEAAEFAMISKAIEKAGVGTLRIFEVDVANLWRLQAQHGLFLESNHALEFSYPPDMIIFPHTDIGLPLDETMVYPDRKSHLEERLDEFFQLARAEQNLRALTENSNGRIRMLHLTAEPSEETASIASTLATWPNKPEWMEIPDERWEAILPNLNNALPVQMCSIESDSSLMLSLIEERRRTPNLLTLLCEEAPLKGFTQEAVDRLWNAMRFFPYEGGQILASLRATIQLARALVGVRLSDGHQLKKAAGSFYGNAIEIEIGGKNGVSTRAFVRVETLLNALTQQARVKLGLSADAGYGEIVAVLQEHYSIAGAIFDHTSLVQLFADQIIPWQIACGRSIIISSPHHIEHLGLP